MVDYSPKNYKDFLYTIEEIEKLFTGIEIQAVIKGGTKPPYFEVLKPSLIYT